MPDQYRSYPKRVVVKTGPAVSRSTGTPVHVREDRDEVIHGISIPPEATNRYGAGGFDVDGMRDRFLEMPRALSAGDPYKEAFNVVYGGGLDKFGDLNRVTNHEVIHSLLRNSYPLRGRGGLLSNLSEAAASVPAHIRERMRDHVKNPLELPAYLFTGDSFEDEDPKSSNFRDDYTEGRRAYLDWLKSRGMDYEARVLERMGNAERNMDPGLREMSVEPRETYRRGKFNQGVK